MTGIDTNVLIRFVMADDVAQYRKADRLMQSFSAQSPGFITQVCLAEFVWVLRSQFRQPKETIVRWLSELVYAPELVLENQSAVEQALHTYSTSRSDFADCLIERVSHIAGCTSTVTFDNGAAKAAGMRLL
jgi:predicted nucleic-acid-binding protein